MTDKVTWLAENLFGWKRDVIGGFGARDVWYTNNPPPPGRGANIREINFLEFGDGALEVIEAMRKQGWEVTLEGMQYDWWCLFTKEKGEVGKGQNKDFSTAVIEAAYEALT